METTIRNHINSIVNKKFYINSVLNSNGKYLNEFEASELECVFLDLYKTINIIEYIQNVALSQEIDKETQNLIKSKQLIADYHAQKTKLDKFEHEDFIRNSEGVIAKIAELEKLIKEVDSFCLKHNGFLDRIYFNGNQITEKIQNNLNKVK